MCIPNYSIVRLDRIRHGGGVALYIHNSITYNIVFSSLAGLEVLFVSLPRNTLGQCLFVFYRTPLSVSCVLDTCCDILFSLSHSYFTDFVILGDFNVNFTDSRHLYGHQSDFMSSFSRC